MRGAVLEEGYRPSEVAAFLGIPYRCDSGLTGTRGGDLSKLRKSGTVTENDAKLATPVGENLRYFRASLPVYLSSLIALLALHEQHRQYLS